MTTNTAGDQATVTVSVAVPIAEAFRIFTEEIDLWWRRGPRFRNSGSAGGDAAKTGIICIESRVDGRVFESFAVAGVETVVEIGHIKMWDPPKRLLFEWRNSNFADNEKTEVEVLFAETRSGTRVTVMHRGWSVIRGDHPVRHGLPAADFIRMMGLWWGDQMTTFRLQANSRADASQASNGPES